MPQTGPVRLTLAAAILAFAGFAADGGPPSNDLPQPYRTIRDWAHPPDGLPWAAVTGVEPGPDGNIYVLYRCFENSCANRPEAPILKFDPSGKLLKSWGAGMFVFPHGSTIDHDGNFWATDA